MSTPPTNAEAAETACQLSMSSAADFPVKTSASPAAAPGSTESARVFGPRCSDSFASFDPDTCSWKTSQLSLLEEWAEFSETWPRAAMTQNMTAFLLRPLALLTAETGSGSWPTPHGMPKDGQPRNPGPSGNELGRAVNQAERETWPTPDGSVANLGEGPETFYARREKLKEKGYNGNGAGVPLAIAAQVGEHWRERSPTPTATDCESSGGRNTSAAKPDSRTHAGTSLTDYVRSDRMLPTPTAQDAKNDGGPSQMRRNSLPLNAVAKRWPTPQARDWKQAPGRGTQERGGHQSSLPTVTREQEGSGALNPEFVEGLMGYPHGWTELPD